MFRYVAACWDGGDEAQSRAARSLAARLSRDREPWECALRTDGLMVWHAGRLRFGARVHALESSGVVLGTLFRRPGTDGDSNTTQIGSTDASEILRSAGRRLVDRFWGRYVCFIHDSQERSVRVLRDPSGGLPCMFSEWRDVRVVFSLSDDRARLGLGSETLDWQYIEAFVAASILQSTATGFREVRELQAGECMTWRWNRAPLFEFYWHPLRVLGDDSIQDPETAVGRIRETTLACLDAWGNTYPRILHHLSGGLDSSIICSGLRAATSKPAVECINYYSASAEGDERRYARLVASRNACKLHEFEIHGSSLSLQSLLMLAPSPRPTTYIPALLNESIEPELREQLTIHAYCDGNGGDQAFCNGRFALAAYDYVREHGLSRRAVRMALHAARLSGRSLWSVLAAATVESVRKRGWDPLQDIGLDAQLASDTLLEHARRDTTFVHPWLLDAAELPPGKFHHLQMLSYRTEFYNPLHADESAEPIRPLTSQPLVELCLQVPTYLHSDGGVSRSLARRAFTPLLPAEIVTRSAKGGATNHSAEVLAANLDFVREVLLDGQLVGRGLLDRSKLTDALSMRPDRLRADPAEILDHACTELWIAACLDAPRPSLSYFGDCETEAEPCANCAS